MATAWRKRYAYVKPYALQSREFVLHELAMDGSYFPRHAVKST